MKKFFILFFLFAFFCCFPKAQQIKLQGITYEVNQKNKTAKVFDAPNIKKVVIPESIIYRLVDYTVTTIGSKAFQYKRALTEVVLPPQLSVIETEAFFKCERLNKINLEQTRLRDIGDYAFDGCLQLTDLVLPYTMTWVADSFFPPNIKRLYMSAKVNVYKFRSLERFSLAHIEVAVDNPRYSSVDGVLFDKGKTTLLIYPRGKTDTTYCVPNGVETIRSHAFESNRTLRAINLPHSLTQIQSNGFAFCPNLKKVNFENTSLTNIGEGAFNQCRDLREAILPQGLTAVGKYAFWFCNSLAKVFLPNSVASLGESAFASSGVKSVFIPASVASVPVSVFADCIHLESFAVDSGNPALSSSDGVLFDKKGTTLISYPIANRRTSYQIPQGVTKILSLRTIHLKSLSLPESLSAIKVGSVNCDSLSAIRVADANPSFSSQDGVLFNKDKTTLIIYPSGKPDSVYSVPQGVTAIQSSAFTNYLFLKSIRLPSSLKQMGALCRFYDSDDSDSTRFVLTPIYCAAPIPPYIESEAIENSDFYFSDPEHTTLYVPKGSKKKYCDADGWGKIGKIIEIENLK